MQRTEEYLKEKFIRNYCKGVKEKGFGNANKGENMKIGIGNDHTGVELKEYLKDHLRECGMEVVDFGVKAGERCDYPVPGRDVAEAILEGKIDKGVLICGTGIGISVAANKVPGIRAAVCSEPYSAKMASLHNNAQIIAVGARVVGVELAKMIVDTFLTTEFEGGRHTGRIAIITEIEEKYSSISLIK